MINVFAGACGRVRRDHLVHLARGVSSARKQYFVASQIQYKLQVRIITRNAFTARVVLSQGKESVKISPGHANDLLVHALLNVLFKAP